MRRAAAWAAWGVALVALGGCNSKRYKMPSGSMIPSIDLGATVTADKSIKTAAPGEVFVFQYPEHPDQSFVQRVVAIGGQKVETKGEGVLVDGKPNPTCSLGRLGYTDPADSTARGGDLLLEQ